jgi:cardiolipin synthase (CMP-forming)
MTIPNYITIFRFFLVPLVLYAIFNGQMWLALTGFVVAGVSDGVDGYIARRFNQRSELGAYLDPVADKILLVSIFVTFGYVDDHRQSSENGAFICVEGEHHGANIARGVCSG